MDGYGRWVASQLINKEKYKDLEVLVVLDPPEDKEERLKLEATLYAFQNIGVAKMTPIHKHGAMLVLHDEATETMEKLKKKYGFEYKAKAGYRGASVLGLSLIHIWQYVAILRRIHKEIYVYSSTI